MKLLSIAIPCYNSQDYMENCIESLLVGGEEVEILIVDDGSSDRTAEIADDYARKYPTIVRQSIRKMVVMEKLSMQGSEMLQDCISR